MDLLTYVPLSARSFSTFDEICKQFWKHKYYPLFHFKSDTIDELNEIQSNCFLTKGHLSYEKHDKKNWMIFLNPIEIFRWNSFPCIIKIFRKSFAENNIATRYIDVTKSYIMTRMDTLIFPWKKYYKTFQSRYSNI